VSQSEEEEELVKGVALLGAVCVVLMSWWNKLTLAN
jgi:hypothetical protein